MIIGRTKGKTASGSGFETSDLVMGGAILAGAWMLKDTFSGVGKGVGDFGAGLKDLLTGLGGGVRDVTSIVPAIESGAAATGSNIGQWLGNVGDSLGNFGHLIDLSDQGKYDWLAGPHGMLAGIGDNLGAFRNDVSQTASNFGSAIDVTDPNGGVQHFLGWINPFN